MIHRRLVATALMGLLALTAGCGDDAGEASPALRVTYIPKNLGNPYFDSIVKGLRTAGKQDGFKVNVVGPAQAGATDQLPFIDAAIQQRVDAIAISPNDPDAVVPSLKRAMDAGIEVVAVNSDMNAAGRQVAVLPTNFDTLGRFLVELQGGLIGYAGTFAVLSATSTAPDQNFWIEGIKETLKSEPKYRRMRLVDVVYGDDEPDKSFAEAEALMNKHPDLDGITSPTTVGVAAAAEALAARGDAKARALKLTGLGTPDQMRKFIKDGTVTRFALWDPEKEGLLSGHLIARIVRGEVDLEAGTTVELPGLGSVRITERTQVITGPPVVFDGKSIDRYSF